MYDGITGSLVKISATHAGYPPGILGELPRAITSAILVEKAWEVSIRVLGDIFVGTSSDTV